MSLLAQRPVDLVLSDIYMPGEDGLSLLSRLREGPRPPKIVLMTARGSIETATIAARLGATDTVRPVGAERSEPVDVRVVAATHRDLAAQSAAGSFRQDLYFRLAGYEMRLPALRERLSDLPHLVEHFRAAAVRELGLAETSPASSAVLAAFAAHSWPGNVRELEQVVRRLLIDTGALSDASAAVRFLASSGRAATPATPDVSPAPQPRESAAAGLAEPLQSLDEIERRHILEVLAATGGNRSAAARILGIERKTLSRKLKAWGTPDPDGDDPESV